MELVDLLIFVIYMIVMLGVGVYFMRKNEGNDDYYVGGRNMGAWHIGLSVVATDVGGAPKIMMKIIDTECVFISFLVI